MLYPRKNDPALTEELFQNPGSEYRGTPFWAWNCQLQKDELLRQLEVMKKMGFGGAHMHVRTGMATPYLSDEHMDLISACVEKCRDEKLLAWLYDEDRWPSGAAGGIVTKEKKYRARYLLFTPIPYSNSPYHKEIYYSGAQAERSEKGRLLACYDIVLDETGALKSGSLIDPGADAMGTKWFAYLETPNESPWFNNQTYVNTLDCAAMARFIEVTYERYLETVGQDFGGVVPAIFTDEPQFTHKQALFFPEEKKDVILPWSDDLAETFRAAYGEDLMASLPELFWDLPEGQVSTVRYHYHDHICERFTQAFADQCGTWCENHGLMLTGHMMDEPTLRTQTGALGEAMRSYRSFQLPGIDMLCNSFEFTTAKQAQSASRQFGREGVLSELYGVTGWDFDFRGHKLQGDWQAALGVTVRVPHLSWVSMKGEAKRDYPASINYQSPWWEDYAYVEDHFARVNTAMTRGKAISRVGVIHPVESYWLHFGPNAQTSGIRNQMEENFKNLTEWLLNGSIDFDFISESLLPQQCESASNPLQVGEMAYDAILVPGCETLRSTTLERLEAFAAQGGQLIFLGGAPRYADAVPSDRGRKLWESAQRLDFSRNAILEALESVRMVDIVDSTGVRTDHLIHQLRKDGNDCWLFVSHSRLPYNPDVPEFRDVRISLAGEFAVTLYDTLTGEIRPMALETVNGKTIVQARLYDYDSLLLHYSPAGDAAEASEDIQAAATVLHVPHRVPYTLSEPNVYLLDKAEFALNDGAYHPQQELLRADNVLREMTNLPSRQAEVAQPWTVTDTSMPHTVKLKFRVDCASEVPHVVMALEDADMAKITLNGNPVSSRPDGWFTDKSIGTVPLGTLVPGENIIEVALPFGPRSNIEWCYLLGDFGVEVFGEYRQIVARKVSLGFDDITRQGLAHYSGNLTYHLRVTTTGGDLAVTVPHYAGAAVRVEVDGRQQYTVYPPYRAVFTELEAGEHRLDIVLLGNRQNAFGPVHLADAQRKWIGPDAWRTAGATWTESYRLKPIGLLSAPIVEEWK